MYFCLCGKRKTARSDIFTIGGKRQKQIKLLYAKRTPSVNHFARICSLGLPPPSRGRL